MGLILTLRPVLITIYLRNTKNVQITGCTFIKLVISDSPQFLIKSNKKDGINETLAITIVCFAIGILGLVEQVFQLLFRKPRSMTRCLKRVIFIAALSRMHLGDGNQVWIQCIRR